MDPRHKAQEDDHKEPPPVGEAAEGRLGGCFQLAVRWPASHHSPHRSLRDRLPHRGRFLVMGIEQRGSPAFSEKSSTISTTSNFLTPLDQTR